MDHPIRSRFNAAWTPDLYRHVKTDLARRLACKVPFPVAETPIFLPLDAVERFQGAGEDLMEQLESPAFIAKSEQSVPKEFRSGGRGPLPQFAQLDFAVVRAPDGTFVPKLVELQGFPSLYGFQIMLADVWASHITLLPGLPDRWRLFYSGIDRYRAMALLREAILGGHEPDEVCLLDIDPATQKTMPDFAVTQRWFGVDPICLTELIREGDRIFRRKEGKLVPVRRIYHRIVFDELKRSGKALPFDVREPLEVEWAPHPAWFYAWSKNSLFDLHHPCVPKTLRVSELDTIPDDLSGYVLKPLYSFAGGGVNVEPTPAAVRAIPEEEREGWVLQERIEYADAFHTPRGEPVKAELRLMYVRPDDHEHMTLLMTLGRLSRGKMMGVDFNKDLDWTGASVAFWADWAL